MAKVGFGLAIILAVLGFRLEAATGDPAVLSFAPREGGAGTSVLIEGLNFGAAIEVRFGNAVAVFSVLSSSAITATVPLDATTGPIMVRNSRGAGYSALSFQVPPRVESFSPESAPPGGQVVLTGLNFEGATAVRFNGTNALFVVTAATQITATVPLTATSGPISVTTAAGTGVSAQGFVVRGKGPVIQDFSPASGPPGTIVVISGQNFAGTTNVTFGGTNAAFAVTAFTQMQAVVPSGAQTGPIVVSSPQGVSTSSLPFTVVGKGPVITNFTPTSGRSGSVVVISGERFIGATNVSFGGLRASFAVTAATQITAVVPSNATNAPITVSTPEGTGASSQAFVVTGGAPLITSFQPEEGTPGTVITISGHDFVGATRVTFNGAQATFVITAPTMVQAVVPLSATTGPIGIATPLGTNYSADAFLVLNHAPWIDSFTPNHGGPETDVLISGRNLAGVTRVRFGDVDAAFAVTADTQMHAKVPAGAVTAPISLVSLGGTNVSTNLFYLPPRIDAFQPSLTKAGDLIQLTGLNFTDASSVAIGGALAAYEIKSATNLTARVAEASVTGPVTLNAPGGLVSTTNSLRIAPTIVDFTPSAGPTGSQVTVTGTAFTNVVLVQVGATAAAFEVDHARRLRLTIPSGATTAPITVTTTEGSATSAQGLIVTLSSDLGVRVWPSTNAVEPGGTLEYQVVVTNAGPTIATQVRLTNLFPANVQLQAAEIRRGELITNNTSVVCVLGLLTNATAETLRLLVVPTRQAVLTNVATVSAVEPDIDLGNNVSTNFSLAVPSSSRALSLAWDAERELQLSWPTSAIPFRVVAKPALDSATAWIQLTNSVQKVGGLNVIHGVEIGDQRHFELSWP